MAHASIGCVVFDRDAADHLIAQVAVYQRAAVVLQSCIGKRAACVTGSFHCEIQLTSCTHVTFHKKEETQTDKTWPPPILASSWVFRLLIFQWHLSFLAL